jgi:hypothetical protein
MLDTNQATLKEVVETLAVAYAVAEDLALA